MTRTIGAAIGLVLVVLFLASLDVEQSRNTSAVPSVAITARR